MHREHRHQHQLRRWPRDRRRGGRQRAHRAVPEHAAVDRVDRPADAVVVEHEQRLVVDHRRELEQRAVAEAPADVQRRAQLGRRRRRTACGRRRSRTTARGSCRRLAAPARTAARGVVVVVVGCVNWRLGWETLPGACSRTNAAAAAQPPPGRPPPRRARAAAVAAERDSAWRHANQTPAEAHRPVAARRAARDDGADVHRALPSRCWRRFARCRRPRRCWRGSSGADGVHLVGGAVRDLMLRRGAAAISTSWSRASSTHVIAALGGAGSQPRAVRDLHGRARRAFATTSRGPAARRYPAPGALPEVAPADLADRPGAPRLHRQRDRAGAGGAEAGTLLAVDDAPGRPATPPAPRPARRQLHRRSHPAAAAGAVRGPAVVRGRAAHARPGRGGGRRGRPADDHAAPAPAPSCACWPPSPTRWRPSRACASWGSTRRSRPGSGSSTRRWRAGRWRCWPHDGDRGTLVLAAAAGLRLEPSALAQLLDELASGRRARRDPGRRRRRRARWQRR